jgi:molybdopterin-binding protein
VPTYRIGQVAELFGVSTDTVRRWADAAKVTATVTEGGSRSFDGADLARFATAEADAAAGNRQRRQSARNCFLGIITHVTKDGVAAQVNVVCGSHRFVSLITREAADELELVPGMIAEVVVKATNVGIELPDKF